MACSKDDDDDDDEEEEEEKEEDDSEVVERLLLAVVECMFEEEVIDTNIDVVDVIVVIVDVVVVVVLVVVLVVLTEFSAPAVEKNRRRCNTYSKDRNDEDLFLWVETGLRPGLVPELGVGVEPGPGLGVVGVEPGPGLGVVVRWCTASSTSQPCLAMVWRISSMGVSDGGGGGG